MPLLKRLVLAVLLAALLLPGLVAAQQGAPVATVNTGMLNVRSGPGLQYGAIATLPYGFGVTLVARNTEMNWVLIALTTGLRGWVNVNYLYTTYRISDLPIDTTTVVTGVTPTGTIRNAVNVNVRTAPDPNSTSIAVIDASVTFQLIGRNYNATWAQIRLPDGRTGWINAQFVAGTVPVRGLAPADGSVVGPPVAAPGATIHVVQPGETLGSIAQRYGVNVYTVAAANGISNINVIYAGQRLVIPR